MGFIVHIVHIYIYASFIITGVIGSECINTQNIKDDCNVSKNSKNRFNSFILDGILVTLTVLLLLHWWSHGKKKNNNLPPGPRGLPILGYLPFLGKEPYKDRDNLSKTYGNVFGFHLGSTYVVILGDFEAFKEALSQNTTLNRPEGVFDFLPDGGGFASNNGIHWVEQRRFSVKAMRDLGLGRSKWEDLVQEEVNDFIKLMYSFEGKPFNVFRYIALSVSNNMASLVFGRRLPFNDKNVNFVTESLEKLFRHWSQIAWWNFFPGVHNMLSKMGFVSVSTSRQVFEVFNNFIREQVEIQKKSYFPGSTENFIHEFLTEIKENEERENGNNFDEHILRGNVQAIYLGGSGTTSVSLNWLMLCMAKFKDIQKKVHEELNTVLGKDGKIQYSERYKLPYTLAVIMEGQRYRTMVPLNTSRMKTQLSRRECSTY